MASRNKPAEVLRLTPELIAKAREDRKICKPKSKSKEIPASEVGEGLGLSEEQAKNFKVEVRIDGTVKQATDLLPRAERFDNAIALALTYVFMFRTKAEKAKGVKPTLLFCDDDGEDLLINADMLPFLSRATLAVLELKGVDPDAMLSDEELKAAEDLEKVKKS